MTNFSTADVLVYKDGSTTERASTSGFTATTDFDSKTGKHLIAIDLADNTTAGFWGAGSEYLVAIDSVTVDAVTVGAWVARFRIGYAGAMLDTTIASLSSQTSFTLTAGPAEDDALNGCEVIIHDIASAVQCGKAVVSDYTGSTKTVTLAAGVTFTAATGDNVSVLWAQPVQPTTAGRTLDVTAGGCAGIDWANVEAPTTALALTGTTIATTQKVDVETVKTQSVTCAAGVTVGAFVGQGTAAIGVNASGHVSRVVLCDTITTYTGDTPQTGDSFARIGAAGASLTDLGGMSTTMKGQVQTEAEDALVVHRLDELLNADSDIDGAAPPTVGSVFHELMTKTAGSFTYDQTTDSLEALRDRGDAAWITATGFSTHSAADVWAVATRVLTAGTNVDGSTFTAVPWNAAWDAEVQSEVQDAIEANNLDHLVKAAVDTNFATTVHLDSVIGHLADAGGTATFDRTTDALEVLGAATAPSAASIADAVWDETLADHLAGGSTGAGLNSASSAGDPWGTALPGAYGAGSAGNILGNRLVGTIATGTHTPQTGDAYARLGAPAGASVSADVAAVKTQTAAIETDTQDIQSRLPVALLGGNMPSVLADGVAHGGTTATLTLGATGQAALSVRSNGSGTYAAEFVNTDGSGVLARGASATGGIGLHCRGDSPIVGNITGNITGSLSGSTGDSADIDAIKAKTDNLPTDPADQSAVEAAITAAASGLATAANLATVAGYLDTEVAAILEDTGTTLPAQIAALNNLSAAQVNAECDAALADAGVTTTVTGRIDAAVSTRLATASYTAPPTAAENADALIGRNIAGGSSTGRTVKQALSTLRNKVTISGGVLTVYDTDDVSVLYTAVVTSDAAADPVTSVDPG